jgi:hypothetical protein
MAKGTVLHQRAYEIESVVEDDTHIRLTGHLRDVKPDGLWGIPHDTAPLTVHHMQVDLVIDAYTLVITEAQTTMHVHPHDECPFILAAYGQLVGLSIARGFTHKVRELFGGPRACTHIGALIIAMAPVAIQSMWGFHRYGASTDDGSEPQPESFERNRNTCHVWADDGPMFAFVAEHGSPEPPLWAVRRLEEYGMDPAAWRANGN